MQCVYAAAAAAAGKQEAAWTVKVIPSAVVASGIAGKQAQREDPRSLVVIATATPQGGSRLVISWTILAVYKTSQDNAIPKNRTRHVRRWLSREHLTNGETRRARALRDPLVKPWHMQIISHLLSSRQSNTRPSD